MTPDNQLTHKQMKFVSGFLEGKSKTQAARDAGYVTPERSCTKLMATPKILDAIERGQRDVRAATTIELEKVLREIARIAFADVRGIFSEDGRLLPPHEWPDNAAAAIAAFDVVTVNKGEGEVEHVAKVKTWTKTDALDKLMRYLGAYAPDKVDVKHDITEIERKLHEGRDRVARLKVVGGSEAA